MKKLSNNKKGFTLIELLAVIVILAILVMVAIPAVTKYLNTSRSSAFIDNAKAAVEAVRNDYVITGGANGGACKSGAVPTSLTGHSGLKCYDMYDINKLLEKQLASSPYGGDYSSACVVVSEKPTTAADQTDQFNSSTQAVTYSVCLIDGKGNGIQVTPENDITAISNSLGASATCTCK